MERDTLSGTKAANILRIKYNLSNEFGYFMLSHYHISMLLNKHIFPKPHIEQKLTQTQKGIHSAS